MLNRLASLLVFTALTFAQSPQFQPRVIDTGLKGGYHVTAADINRDGKPDIIALSSGMSELVWYENPSWARHVLGGGFSGMINCAYLDNAGDGKAAIVLAAGFAMRGKQSSGEVYVLRPGADVRAPWSSTKIDQLPTSHRIRVARLPGEKLPVFINSALAAAEAEPPDYRGITPLVFYRPGEWKRVPITPENRGLVHGLTVIDLQGKGVDTLLTAGFEGIHHFVADKKGVWRREAAALGDPAPWPKSGSSDTALGKMGSSKFIAAIEPWHGNQVSVYRAKGRYWDREVIDTSLVDGHTIQTADFNGDGVDEIVAGFRGGTRSVHVYTWNAREKKWIRSVVDEGGMAGAGCAVADFNGDGKTDFTCIGTATANLKWYENVTPRK